MLPDRWIPCSAHETVEEMVWLPRLLQKARRHEASRAGGPDFMNGYLYGDGDVIDAALLRFLRIDDRAVSALVRAHADDETAARIIVERSGRTIEERRSYNARLRRQFFNFELTEADERRTPPGMKRTLLRFFYNRLMMPVVTILYRRAERARAPR